MKPPDLARKGRLPRYANAHYQPNVLSWIASCIDVVRDEPNLHNVFAALVDYRTAVQRITKTYKSQVMNLENFLQQSSPELDLPALTCLASPRSPAPRAVHGAQSRPRARRARSRHRVLHSAHARV